MTARISLKEFNRKYVRNSDPWSTLSCRDEAIKRRSILYALGPGPHGRILELGSGAGANSRELAARCLRLDTCDGAPAAVLITRQKLAPYPRANAHYIVLPSRFPARQYDAIVVAELLYYFTENQMRQLANDVLAALPCGRLVLAHHKAKFADAAQSGDNIHQRFMRVTGYRPHRIYEHHTRCWVVESFAFRQL